jgi:Uncharacterised nucleotidyltransferase
MPDNTAQPLARATPADAELLFATARTRMTPQFAERIRTAVRGEVNWINVVQLAMQHETTPLLYWNLHRVCADSVPAGVLEPLAARFEAQVTEARQRMEELVRILAALEQAGVFAVAYKGPMLSHKLYGHLSLREFSETSDLDIMIYKRDLWKAQRVIRGQGYRLWFLPESKLRRYAWIYRELHFLREQGGERLLELHWRFAMRSARIPNDPQRFLKQFEMIPFAGANLRSLPLEVYFLILSLHATKHRWRKLKLICDIAEILGFPNVDWEYVAHEARQLGLKRTLAVGILLAADPLEVAAPAVLLKRLKIDRAAQRLAADCREALLREPDERWRKEVEYKFLLDTRDRLRDRARMFLWNRAIPKITPVAIRPTLRMAWEKIAER